MTYQEQTPSNARYNKRDSTQIKYSRCVQRSIPPVVSKFRYFQLLSGILHGSYTFIHCCHNFIKIWVFLYSSFHSPRVLESLFPKRFRLGLKISRHSRFSSGVEQFLIVWRRTKPGFHLFAEVLLTDFLSSNFFRFLSDLTNFLAVNCAVPTWLLWR